LIDEVRNKERREQGHPKSLRWWALLKNLENENLTPEQLAALQELVADQSATADAWVIKEKLRWIQKAPTSRSARSRTRCYRNEANFIAMIYLIGSPVGRLFYQAKST